MDGVLMVEDRYSDMDTVAYGPFETFGAAKRKALEILDGCTESDLKRRTGGRSIVVCRYLDDIGMDVDDIVDVVAERD